jgi:hypothetical protein
MISPDELSEMESTIKEALEAEGTPQTMIGMGINIRLEAYIEERAGILPYEEWREQQR